MDNQIKLIKSDHPIYATAKEGIPDNIEDLARLLMPHVLETIFTQFDAVLECYPQARDAIRKCVLPKPLEPSPTAEEATARSEV